MGCVYLLHFSRPVGRARHYVGKTDRALAARLAEHRAGRGSRLTRGAVKIGAAIRVARVWEDAVPARLERAIKRRGGFRRLCPVCRGE